MTHETPISGPFHRIQADHGVEEDTLDMPQEEITVDCGKLHEQFTELCGGAVPLM